MTYNPTDTNDDGTVDADVDNTNTTSQTLDTGDTQTETIGAGDYHYAGDYDGADADARLDNALSASGADDTIYLEGADYTADRTISTDITLVANGQGVYGNTASRFADNTVTLDGFITLQGINANSSATIVVNSLICSIYQAGFGGGTTITVKGDDFRMYGCRNGSVTFESGNSGGIVDACTGTSVTDNDGGNTVGDIA